MKKVIRKTEEEIREEDEKRIKRNLDCRLEELRFLRKDFYGYCDKCKIAFFKYDMLYICSDDEIRCRNCKSILDSFGSEEDFERYYKLEDEANKQFTSKPIPSYKPIHFDNS